MGRSYDVRDPWYRKAKQENLRARSAFKLDEIQRRWKLVRRGDSVIDLGAAPGGFLQILAAITGPEGRVVGVDLESIRPLGKPIATIEGDVHDPKLADQIRAALGGELADVLTSDLAPKTTGIRGTDEARSIALVERALELAGTLLEPGGHLVAKVFMGAGFEQLREAMKAVFEEVRIVRPEATRVHSRETYLVALRRRRA